MASIKRIKLPNSSTTYDISAKYDIDGNEIKQVYATKTDLANLVDSAPGTLDTLNELAAALGDDPNFATTVATEIGKKTGVTVKSWSSADVS